MKEQIFKIIEKEAVVGPNSLNGLFRCQCVRRRIVCDELNRPWPGGWVGVYGSAHIDKKSIAFPTIEYNQMRCPPLPVRVKHVRIHYKDR